MRIKKKKINKKDISLLTIILLVLIVIILLMIYSMSYFLFFDDNRKTNNIIKPKDYTQYYSEIVATNKDAKIYELINGKYIDMGVIYKDTKLKLENVVDKTSEYFKIKDLNGQYYIKYSDICKSKSYYNINDRYNNYIPFNKNIITNNITTFYNENGKMYTINESFNLPIIIDEEDKYYIEYNDMLLYIMKEDIKSIVDNNNTEEQNTKGVPVLNYHFVYIPEEEECNQEICHTEEQFRMHLSYIKDNGYFTPTMKELEMYIDGKIQLPKSVMITIDDGRNVNIATKILEEYQLNATAFIVTSRFNIEKDFIKSNYVELQSHSHNLHNAGTCPPGYGQGGGLTCLNDEEILNDLAESRKALNGATAFCYPFFEYNSHSIELLKKAGFTIAFAGEYAGGQTQATVGMDKFRIPRWVIVTYTTMSTFISYVSGSV